MLQYVHSNRTEHMHAFLHNYKWPFRGIIKISHADRHKYVHRHAYKHMHAHTQNLLHTVYTLLKLLHTPQPFIYNQTSTYSELLSLTLYCPHNYYYYQKYVVFLNSTLLLLQGLNQDRNIFKIQIKITTQIFVIRCFFFKTECVRTIFM